MANITTTLDSPVAAAQQRSFDMPPAVVGVLIAAGATYLNLAISWRQAALFLVGTLAGLVLYHAAFGFTSSWRVFISDRRGAGLRAQLLMLAAASLIFFPLLANGSAFGQTLRGNVSPPGIAVLAGAFIFGIGMQLGGGCASGTLYSAGGGSTRMLIVLAAFIVGSVIGTAHVPWWTAQPAFAPTSLVTAWGAAPALAANLAAFLAIAGATVVLERRRYPSASVHTGLWEGERRGAAGWLRGPWPLVAGAIGLAAVNVLTLLIAGRPWGVTSAFALWGAKAAVALGLPVDAWPYWTTPAQANSLQASVLSDVTSVMNIGIMLGALLAAVLAGRFNPVWRVPARSLAAAVAGGLLLGYGARVAYGCNIGAYFSGIASGSLHGWLWLPAAFAGNMVGTGMRPWFGLSVERSPRTSESKC